MSGTKFPKEPKNMGSFWDVSNNPPLASRWQRVTINGQTFHVFWYGNCLYCGVSTWATADGTILSEMGGHGLMPVTDEDGITYRACARCGQDRSRTRAVITEGRRLKEAGDEYGPIVWPDRHPERVVTAR